MRIGFLGAGNMTTALVEGMLRGGVAKASLAAYDLNPARMEAMRGLGIETAEGVRQLAEAVDVTVLAVKPHAADGVLAQLRGAKGKALVSIAAGLTMAQLKAALPDAGGIVRAMPNTPAQIGEGVTALCEEHTMRKAPFDELRRMLDACGRTVLVPERLMEAVTAISGSGPAYAYLFIEALADGGVRQGLPRDVAYTLAAQTVAGAGKMVLETGRHPGELKDAVTSPGGTTIEAVYALEKAGLRAAVQDAVDACARKAAAMARREGEDR